MPERIRILKFVNAFAIGGTERQFMALAERLSPRAFELHLACIRRWGEMLEQAEALGVPLAAYPLSGLHRLDSWVQRLRFARYLRRHAVQIVHSYSFYPNVFAIPTARAARVPLVVASIRDLGADLTPLQKRVQRIACRFADCILVNADAVRGWLVREGYEASKIRLIPNGLDTSRFTVRSGEGRLRRELRLGPDAPIVAVLSRLSPVKGLDCFLQAAAELARHLPVRFVVAGEARRMENGRVVPDLTYREALCRSAQRLGLNGQLIFTGWRTDIPEILPEVTVSVLPSITEGLSNTLLESMAAGRAVVATRVGGTPEVVEDGVTGLLVPPNDAGALAGAVRRLLEDAELRERLGRAARRLVLERFSIERMVTDTERLYEEELRRRRPLPSEV